jgi:hypothetical protein
MLVAFDDTVASGPLSNRACERGDQLVATWST